nr:putative nuclease HARBI1 [Onthophagus taurus]
MDFERESSSDEEMIEDLEEINELFPIRGGRVMKEKIDHVHHLSDAEFVKRFRLSKECFHRLLSEVEENIKPRTERYCILYNLVSFVKLKILFSRNSAIFASNRLLLTLRFFATGNMLLAVADFCGVSEAAASQIVKLVAIAIANLRPQYCKMPEGDDIGKAQRNFYNIARFPLVIGTIDCTHVRIQSPGGDQAENFRNRKGYFSFNVQTVSDANLKILDIVARWPGSTHDQTIFNNSSIRNRFEQGHFGNGILLGDSGYRNTNYLLTPLVAPRTEAERLYNEAQIRTRNVVERQYGVWKRRFQVLRLEMRVATER